MKRSFPSFPVALAASMLVHGGLMAALAWRYAGESVSLASMRPTLVPSRVEPSGIYAPDPQYPPPVLDSESFVGESDGRGYATASSEGDNKMTGAREFMQDQPLLSLDAAGMGNGGTPLPPSLSSPAAGPMLPVGIGGTSLTPPRRTPKLPPAAMPAATPTEPPVADSPVADPPTANALPGIPPTPNASPADAAVVQTPIAQAPVDNAIIASATKADAPARATGAASTPADASRRPPESADAPRVQTPDPSDRPAEAAPPPAEPRPIPRDAVAMAVPESGAFDPAGTGPDPAPNSDTESSPTTTIKDELVFRNGKLEAKSGRKVRVRHPRLSLGGQIDLYALTGRSITLQLTTDATGKVTTSGVLRSSNSEIVDKSYRVAAYDWWFEPPTNSAGEPMPADYTITIHFL